MANSAEVVILGGGIVGCATAYLLAKDGADVTIIEKGAVAGCASGFAAGLLNPLNGHGIPGPLETVAMESFRMHLDLAEEVKSETGLDPKLRVMPCVWLVFNEEEAAEFQEIYQRAQETPGFPARWLEGEELRALEPRVSPQVIKGMRLEGTMQLASYEYTLAISQAAQKRGVKIRHATVRGLARSNGNVSKVLLDGQEEVACKKVVVALGPWTGQAEEWLGIPIRVSPLKGQILRLDLPGPPLQHIFYRSGGGYVAPKHDGLTWIGTTEETVGFNDEPTQEARDYIMQRTLKIMPGITNARVDVQTACLRPLSADGLPIIGRVPGWDGVYLATGAGRKGILLGPAMARATADLVATGQTSFPIDHFSPDRFAKVSTG